MKIIFWTVVYFSPTFSAPLIEEVMKFDLQFGCLVYFQLGYILQMKIIFWTVVCPSVPPIKLLDINDSHIFDCCFFKPIYSTPITLKYSKFNLQFESIAFKKLSYFL